MNKPSLLQILFKRHSVGTLKPTRSLLDQWIGKFSEKIHDKVWNQWFTVSSIYKTQLMFGNVESLEDGKYEKQVMKERLLFYQKQKRLLLKKAKERYQEQLLMDELAVLNADIFDEIDRKYRKKTLGDRVEFWKLFFKYLFTKKEKPLLLLSDVKDYDKYAEEFKIKSS
ncbi:predicted protein [Naegleria gruberi]|uniref:Predicted protein n=1 Tax=Naegleria gruberi TaxID=5762 RepID=D2VUQ6_NAEGR|nr:uncharacterized protein NAEGRDRAFT_72748 [Naegleria gruberi]EFC39494.1 predicted protein [Naegleria gruberi]|eukprot:XP_002672238.1 predicted protein [Naegleria gruberi strain NEG-M]